MMMNSVCYDSLLVPRGLGGGARRLHWPLHDAIGLLLLGDLVRFSQAAYEDEIWIGIIDV